MAGAPLLPAQSPLLATSFGARITNITSLEVVLDRTSHWPPPQTTFVIVYSGRKHSASTMHPDAIATLLVLVSIANGAPVLLKKALQDRLSYPIDARLTFFDGRRLFGPSKTIRGAVVSIALTAAAAPLLDLDAAIGALVGGMATIGDLFSSFLKRRLDCAPSSRAIGLDQIPESLFPALACLGLFPLNSLDIIIVVAAFAVTAITLSPLFYRMGIRDRPF